MSESNTISSVYLYYLLVPNKKYKIYLLTIKKLFARDLNLEM